MENPKLLTLDQAVQAREKLRKEEKTVVLTNGVFDLLHTGHLYCLKEARSLGDALFILINSDESVRKLKGPHRPVQGEKERAYALGSLWFTSGVVIFNGKRLAAEIRALEPDVYVKAGNYTLDTLDPDERRALETLGVRIEFVPYLPGYSTSALIKKIKQAY